MEGIDYLTGIVSIGVLETKTKMIGKVLFSLPGWPNDYDMYTNVSHFRTWISESSKILMNVSNHAITKVHTSIISVFSN